MLAANVVETNLGPALQHGVAVIATIRSEHRDRRKPMALLVLTINTVLADAHPSVGENPSAERQRIRVRDVAVGDGAQKRTSQTG